LAVRRKAIDKIIKSQFLQIISLGFGMTNCYITPFSSRQADASRTL